MLSGNRVIDWAFVILVIGFFVGFGGEIARVTYFPNAINVTFAGIFIVIVASFLCICETIKIVYRLWFEK